MSASKALKRKRLEEEAAREEGHKSSPAAPKSTPTQKKNALKKAALSSPAPAKTNGTSDPAAAQRRASAGHNLWKEANAKARADAVSRRTATQKQQSLDPLRNQKGQDTVSPRKPTAALGFFKQFHKKNEVDEGVKRKKTGPFDIEESESEEEEKPNGHVSPKGPRDGQPHSTAKGWVYGKPKKTFEDEIRELEEEARKNAGDEESEDELAGQDTSVRRSSARQPSQNKSVERVRSEQKEEASPSSRTPKPLDRRKSSDEPFLMEDLIHLDTEDDMDVDKPESQLVTEEPVDEMEIDESPVENLQEAPKATRGNHEAPTTSVKKPGRLPRRSTPKESLRATTAKTTSQPPPIEDGSIPKKRLSGRLPKNVTPKEPEEKGDPKASSQPQPQPSSEDASIPKKATGRLPKKGASKPLTTLPEEHLQCIQKILLEKTNRRRTIPLTNLDDEYAKVHSVISQTITAGESNSMLLIGARGSGKSTLINQILSEQTNKHADDFHVVRLNGFIHTDDKIALREIWRQLGKEMDLEEEESTSKNYADTMSKLLALLSHPAEMGTDQPDSITKSVIFVLDEFELFASHPRQTLLYNLFDIAQSRKAPIAVLGLTTKIDVAESLEKRVKSRFSHRYVHLSLPKSYQAYQDVCKAALSITSKELAEEDNGILSDTTTKSAEPMVLVKWNTFAEQMIESEPFRSFLHRLYYTTKSVSDFLVSLTMVLATTPTDSSTTVPSLIDHFKSALAHPPLQPPDSKLDLLSSLSTLQLALLICAARLTNIYGTEVISFALVYEEYKVLASKAKLQASASGAIAQGAGSRVCGKDVAKGAWQELVEYGLIMADGRSGSTGRVDVGLEEIGMSGVELGQWGRWCKEI